MYVKVCTMMNEQQPTTQRDLCHAINNRLNALTLGMSVLETVQDQNLLEIIYVMQDDLDELQFLLKQLRHNDRN